MSTAQTGAGRRSCAAPGVAGWLALAAAPIFAAMAVLSATAGSDSMGMMCAMQASPLTGMTMMYLLMCVFHLTPWVRLIAGEAGR